MLCGGVQTFYPFPHNRIGLAAFIVAASDLSMPRALWAGEVLLSVMIETGFRPAVRPSFPPRTTAHTDIGLCGAFFISFMTFLSFLYIKTPKVPKIITFEGNLTVI